MTLTCFVQVNATDNFKRVEFLINLIASICSKNQFIFFILISPGKQQQHKHPLFLLETFARAAKKKFQKKVLKQLHQWLLQTIIRSQSKQPAH